MSPTGGSGVPPRDLGSGISAYGQPPLETSPRIPHGPTLPIEQPILPLSPAWSPPLTETAVLQEAIKTLGCLAADQRDQRLAAEAEAREMRGHVAALLRVIRGRTRPRQKAYRDIVAAAERALEPGGTGT